MIDKSADASVIAMTIAVYRLLLFAYPARFQREYGPQMVQVFRGDGDCG